jgi:hypothetical protein
MEAIGSAFYPASCIIALAVVAAAPSSPCSHSLLLLLFLSPHRIPSTFMPPPPVSPDHVQPDEQHHLSHQHQLQQQHRLWRLHCMCATLADPCQDQAGATGQGLLYFAEDLGGGGGGTWSVEMPNDVAATKQSVAGNGVCDSAEEAAGPLPLPPASSALAAAAEAAVSDDFEPWDNVTSHDVSLSYWSNSTALQMPIGPANGSPSALLAPGARAFLGLDFLGGGDWQNEGAGSEKTGAGGIAAVGPSFPGWGEFSARSGAASGRQDHAPWS